MQLHPAGSTRRRRRPSCGFVDLAARRSQGVPETATADVVVVGRGAIANLLAARFVRAGLAVLQVSDGLPAGTRTLQIRQDGDSWEAAVPGGPTFDAAVVATARLAVVAVKATQVPYYLRALSRTPLAESTIVAAHNGSDVGASVGQVFRAVVRATAYTQDETVVCHSFRGVLLPETLLAGCLRDLRRALEAAGLRFISAEEHAVELRLKLAVVTTGARMALSDLSIGAALRSAIVRSDLAAIVAESGSVLSSEIAVDGRARFEERCRALATSFRTGALLAAMGSSMGGAYTSLHRDLEYGRETEIDHLNGAVAEEAVRRGIGAPLNQILTDEIRRLTARGMTPAMAARAPDVQRRLRAAFAGAAV